MLSVKIVARHAVKLKHQEKKGNFMWTASAKGRRNENSFDKKSEDRLLRRVTDSATEGGLQGTSF